MIARFARDGGDLSTGHFGAVEFFPATLALHDYPVTMAVNYKTPELKRTLEQMTDVFRVELLDVAEGAVIPRALSALRRGRIFITELDEMESWKPTAHKVMSFFGRRVQLDRAVELLHRRTGAPCCSGSWSEWGSSSTARPRGPGGASRRPDRAGSGRAAAQASGALHLRRPRPLVHLERAPPPGSAPGGMKIRRAEAFLIRLPLRLTVRHALAARRVSSNLLVKLCDEQGNEGWGEGVPRDYVTGENAESSFKHLAEVLLPSLVGVGIDAPDQVLPAVARLLSPSPGNQTCCCAAEFALLDLAGKAFRRSAASWFGGRRRESVRYSVVLPLLEPAETDSFLAGVRSLGVTHLKIKAEGDRWPKTLAAARGALGDG